MTREATLAVVTTDGPENQTTKERGRRRAANRAVAPEAVLSEPRNASLVDDDAHVSYEELERVV